MSTTLGPSWNLRSSSSPRSLTVSLAKSPDGTSSSSSSSSSHHPRNNNPFQDDDHQSSSSAAFYSLAVGTERGSLHHRSYPAVINDNNDSSYVDPDRSVNWQGATRGSVAGILSAHRHDDTNDDSASVFLLLADDDRGSGPTGSPDPGAYAAHLIAWRGRQGTFAKATTHSSNDAGVGDHDGRGRGNNLRFEEASASTSNSNAASSVSLPRMNCAAYHPDSGFVYASGTGVYSLTAGNVKAVLNGMMTPTNNDAASKDGNYARQGGGFGNKYPRIRQSTASSSSSTHNNSSAAAPTPPHAIFLKAAGCLPRPGARCSPTRNSMTLACSGRVAVVAVSNSFYAVPACLDATLGTEAAALSVIGVPASILTNVPNVAASKILAFGQSSQVHPAIVVEVASSSDHRRSFAKSLGDSAAHREAQHARFLKPIASLLILASGRECAAVEIVNTPDPRSVSLLGKGIDTDGSSNINNNNSNGNARIVSTNVKSLPPRHGICNFASPILAAAPLRGSGRSLDRDGRNRHRDSSPSSLTSGPLVALLTVDGLIHLRSPFCLAVPLSSVEVGTRPNDYFSVLPLPPVGPGDDRNILVASYGGEARTVACREESSQEFADRTLKLSIDAFGANGFPRLEAAEALGATFSACSYAGSDVAASKRGLLRQYLEAVLGLADDVRFFMGIGSGNGRGGNDRIVSLVVSEEGPEALVDPSSSGVAALDPNTLITCTALLCLVCFQLDTVNATIANRAAKACSTALGIVKPKDRISKSAMAVCDLVADRLLKEAAAASISLLSSSSSMSTTTRPSPSSASMEYVEAAVWLLRSCGYHSKALQVLEERMNNPILRNASVGMNSGGSSSAMGWSQIKFDSYFAAHLGELWSSKDDACCQLVLRSSATKALITRNPALGLSIFTAMHPQNEKEWRNMKPSDDPLDNPNYPYKVVELLKAINPKTGVYEMESPGSAATVSASSGTLPLNSGRALAVTYLESAIGIASDRPAEDESTHELRSKANDSIADMHDELSYLLLEGVISERGDRSDVDSALGGMYRYKLRRLLSWENAKIRSERLLTSLPSSFLREHALLLGRMGRHEDAIKIFYSDLGSIELALEYCDFRYERQQAQAEEARLRGAGRDGITQHECSYLPLVKVALNSDPDSDRGLAAAIQVLSLRRNSIDKSAALALLPKNVPMSAVVRPFLIPAIVENESQVRRLGMAEALLRSKYMRLKQKLTEAQLKSNASIHSVPALQTLHLGDPLHSSKPTKARPVHLASPHFPDVMLIKYFFQRHLVIQTQVTNTASGQTLADLALVIAESSDEALQPTMEIPLKALPPRVTGSAWVVLTASPQRLETCFLTCELRYTVLSDASTGTHFHVNAESGSGVGRSCVEEIQDIEVRHDEFITIM